MALAGINLTHLLYRLYLARMVATQDTIHLATNNSIPDNGPSYVHSPFVFGMSPMAESWILVALN